MLKMLHFPLMFSRYFISCFISWQNDRGQVDLFFNLLHFKLRKVHSVYVDILTVPKSGDVFCFFFPSSIWIGCALISYPIRKINRPTRSFGGNSENIRVRILASSSICLSWTNDSVNHELINKCTTREEQRSFVFVDEKMYSDSLEVVKLRQSPEITFRV